MAQCNLTIRLDENDKNQFSEICNKIGLSVSAALNVFVKKVINEHRIPFELSDNHFYSEENLRELRRAKKAVEEGKVVSQTYDEFLKMAKNLEVAESAPRFGK